MAGWILAAAARPKSSRSRAESSPTSWLSSAPGGCDRLTRPSGQFQWALEHAHRYLVILHRAGTIGIRLERSRSRPLVIRPVHIVDLEIEPVARDDAEEDAARVEADAPEHRARRHILNVRKLLEHERF